jgi:hypothetical protein
MKEPAPAKPDEPARPDPFATEAWGRFVMGNVLRDIRSGALRIIDGSTIH